MVGRRGEAPLVPPYKFRRPNEAMAPARRRRSLHRERATPRMPGEIRVRIIASI